MKRVEGRKMKKRTYSSVAARFSTKDITWSNLVENRFSAVMIPPLGPRLYLFVVKYKYQEKWRKDETSNKGRREKQEQRERGEGRKG